MIAALVVMAVMVGAVGGAIAWAVGAGLLWGGILTVGAFLAATVLVESYSLKAATLLGLPLLVLAFLIAWLTARYLEARAKFRRIAAALLALGAALVVGFLCLLLGRIELLAPVWVAASADGCLIAALLITELRGRIAR
jgi:hypothetical protein